MNCYSSPLKQNLELRLKVILPEDVGAALMDGVVLCHLANHIRPRSVASIHVPSPAVVSASTVNANVIIDKYHINSGNIYILGMVCDRLAS